MRFVFRADGSETIGFGHLARAVALAGAARRRDVDVSIVSCRPDAAITSFVERAGVPLLAVDCAPGSVDDAAATRGIAGPASQIVVDGYVFDSTYFEELAGDARVVTYVDDLARGAPRCDVILNPNVSASALAYGATRAELLLGPAFAVVHDTFASARAARAARTRLQHLLVTMGSSDPIGATLTVISALQMVRFTRLSVRIVVGSVNARREQILAAAAACTRHDIEVRIDVADMAAEMEWADLAVTASGVTATELSCVGVPGLTFAIANNQESIAAGLARLGMFEVLPFGGGGPGLIAEGLRRVAADPNVCAAMIAAQHRTIDGHGKARVIDRLLAIGERRRHTLAGGDRARN